MVTYNEADVLPLLPDQPVDERLVKEPSDMILLLFCLGTFTIAGVFVLLAVLFQELPLPPWPLDLGLRLAGVDGEDAERRLPGKKIVVKSS